MARSSSTLGEVWMITILIVLTTVCSFAQEAFLVDEFGKHSTEDLMARLDNLHFQLNANDGSIALLRIRRGEKDFAGLPPRYLARMKTYLTNHKADPKRIVVQECDGTADTQYQLLLIPKGIGVPTCRKTLVIPSETKLFDSYFYAYTYPEIDDCCNIPGSDVEGAIASLTAFSELLRKTPRSRGYIIAYNGTNVWGYNYRTLRPLDSAKKATRTAISARRFLMENGIDGRRLTAINGGYRDTLRNVELWFVPEGGQIPKAKPNYFPKRRKSRLKH